MTLSMSPRALPASVALCSVVSFALAGCGTSCDEIIADRDAFFARSTASHAVDAPHASVTVPFGLADRLVAAALADRETDRLALPALDLVGAELGVTFAIAGARLVPAADDRVGVNLAVAVRDGDTPLFTLDVEAQVHPRVDPDRGLVAVNVHPRDVRQLTPRLDPEGRARVTAWLRDALPDVLADVLPDDVLAPTAELAVAWLADTGFPLVRDHLLDDLDAAPLLELALPRDLPLTRVSLRSTASPVPALRFDLVTTLPVARPLHPDPGDAVPNAVELRLAGATAAALANLAMARGALPSRFNEDGEVDPSGPFEARLGWRPGRRPLAVHLWRTAGECVYGRVAGTPRARFTDAEVEVTVSDGVWEEVRGPALTEAFAWTKQLFGAAVRLSVGLARSTRVDVAGSALDLRIGAVQIGRDDLRVALTVRPATTTAPRRPADNALADRRRDR